MGYVINGDAREELRKIKTESIDLVVTDCPYLISGGGCTIQQKKNETAGIFNKREIKKCKSGMYLQGTKHVSLYGCLNDAANNVKTGKMFDNNNIEFSEWLGEVYRVLKQDTHCYIMINGRNLSKLQTEAELVGFKYQQILVWVKNNSTPNKFYLNNAEFILMLRKGKERWINEMGTKNVLSVDNIIGNKIHPTEKPIELMEIMIRNSSKENEIVLDPFCGCGSTLIAAKNLNREYIGIEIDKKYYEITEKRLKDGYNFNREDYKLNNGLDEIFVSNDTENNNKYGIQIKWDI